ncbi:MAG TPA: hypothetical protein VNI54_10995, partial [Thermoanaerobaculia bacterium]|nr:hypothetical protein [Thermoanaerobaculia bacterium]
PLTLTLSPHAGRGDLELHSNLFMKATTLEPLLRSATIKAIDGVAKKLSAAERSAESKVGRLLDHWNELEAADKERVVGIAIATVTTAVTALVALKGKKKTPPVKKAVKKLVKKVL